MRLGRRRRDWTDLVIRELRHHTLESGLPAESHGHVADVLGDAGAASTD